MRFTTFLKLLGFILVSEALGIIGSVFTIPSIPTWYATLNKPFFNPPNWVFGPAWTILYLLLGVAAFLVWEKGWKKKEVRGALTIFAIQFILNIAWTPLFFGLKSPGLALVEIIILWLFILLTIVKFYQISKPAGIILIPYILWVTFATVLNFAVVRLN